MKRRSFIFKAGALISMPLIITEIGCSDNDDSFSTKPAENNAESFSTESTINDGHRHTITILFINVNNPPAIGNTISSSEDFNHTHTIMLNQKQFQQLAAGETITIISSAASGSYSPHTHSFSIKI